MAKEKPTTKICKHCKTEIAYDAKVCPQCRKKQGGGIVKKILIALGVIVIISIVFGGGEDENKPSDSNPQSVGTVENENSENETPEVVDNEFSVGEIVETSDLRISFLSAGEYVSDNDFLEPKDGYMYYRTEFEFENISDTDQVLSSLMDWSCYADDYAMEQSWIGDDVIDTTLSPGKKVKGSIYFEVPVDAGKITIEYETNFWSEDKVVFIVK